MAFQPEVGSGTDRATDYHDLVTKIVAFLTSQHVATVAVNAGGTGYVVGDELTLTHSSAFLDARFRVTSVSGGVITGLAIVASGAFAIRASSATISAGGTGYAVGDILEVQGGSARCNAKFQVDTVSSGAVTAVSVFEDGGAYSSTPSNPVATVGVGPSTFAGGDDCTLTVTFGTLVGTTGLSVTGGTGSGATVDITLAQTGWAVDDRNTNDRSHNSITNEKEVVLVGDAAGRTNKPYIAFSTLTRTSGVDDRYIVALHGMIAHNSSLALSAQPGMLGDPGTWSTGRPYLLCNENQVQEMDFWLTANDYRVGGVININPGAAQTDDGVYMPFYLGFMDSFATETEDPYPMLISGCAQATNIDPASSAQQISGMPEVGAPSGSASGTRFYRSEDSTWVVVKNCDGFVTGEEENVLGPMAELTLLDTSGDPNYITAFGPLSFYTGIGSVTRGSPTRRLRMIPGSTPTHFPLPLTVLSRPGGTTLNETLDSPRGQAAGFFWVYNTDAAGATINDFSEDIIDDGTDRYFVFHNHVHTQLYQYLCIKEDV